VDNYTGKTVAITNLETGEIGCVIRWKAISESDRSWPVIPAACRPLNPVDAGYCSGEGGISVRMDWIRWMNSPEYALNRRKRSHSQIGDELDPDARRVPANRDPTHKSQAVLSCPRTG
jgi:hypothetical protein